MRKTGNETGFTYNAMGSLIDGYSAWIDDLDVLKNAPYLQSGSGILNALPEVAFGLTPIVRGVIPEAGK